MSWSVSIVSRPSLLCCLQNGNLKSQKPGEGLGCVQVAHLSTATHVAWSFLSLLCNTSVLTDPQCWLYRHVFHWGEPGSKVIYQKKDHTPAHQSALQDGWWQAPWHCSAQGLQPQLGGSLHSSPLNSHQHQHPGESWLPLHCCYMCKPRNDSLNRTFFYKDLEELITINLNFIVQIVQGKNSVFDLI